MNYENEKVKTYEKVKIHELINFEKKSMSQVKVSIVIPVCNVEEYLRECLDSAINQTLKEIEIICVNDGSTDNSLDILKEYAQKDSRVKIINKDNAGYGHTMNIGMDMAVGEYIGIIESDDYADLHMYEDLYNIAIEKQVDVIKADFNRFTYENGKIHCVYNDVAKKAEYYNRIVDPVETPFSFRFIMNTWSGIYKREFLEKNEIRHQETPGASFQDNGFWFQTMIKTRKLYIVDKPYYMNRRDNPNSSVHNREKVFCVNQEYKYIYEILKQDPLLFGRFIGEYHLKKYHNYLFSYNRIGNEFKLDYLKAISKEFKEAIDNDELDKSLFYSYELDEFNWIVENPEDYFVQHSENCIKVSVIIPVYNTSLYLNECLDSVLNQSLKEIEVICVDDGSDDDSLKILKEYEKKDCRIKVLTQNHRGGGAARNKGLEIATGEYLSFLDSDDFFESNMLESIYARCKKAHADIGVFRVKRYDNNTKKIISDKTSFVEKNMPSKLAFSPLDMQKNIFNTFQTWPWNKLFRRHFIEKEGIKFQEISRTNDMYFVNTALVRAKRITALPKELVNYRVGTTNNCQATNHLAPTDFFKALLALQDELIENFSNKEYMKSFANLVVRSCNYNLNSLIDAQAYADLYRYLHEIGFKKINIANIDKKNIFEENKNAYQECKKISENSFEEYMFGKLKYYREVSAKNNKKIRELSNEHKNENMKVLSDQTSYRLNCVEDELHKLKQIVSQEEDYKMQLILTRASMTYKIGSFITFVPRKLREKRNNTL